MERPNLHSQKDLLLWQDTPASNIKMTDVWEVVRHKYDEEPWRKLIWFPNTQPRAQWFVWLACNDRLPTFDRQKKSGISLANRCALCLKEEESAHHIMIFCPHSSKIWEFITSKFRRSYNPQHTIVRELKRWFSCSFKRGWLMKCWNICFHIILWRIWCICNARIHKDDTSSSQHDSYAVWQVCVDGFYAIVRDTDEDMRDLQVWLNTGIVPDKCPRIVTGQACLQIAYAASNGRQLVVFMLKDLDGLHRDQGVAWWEVNNVFPEDSILRQIFMAGGLENFHEILLISNNKPWTKRLKTMIHGRRSPTIEYIVITSFSLTMHEHESNLAT
ncbi:hypothetical protein EJ110_NYTH36327 [Nymphaea thermarum]|nr:hypothetical protein EJ110_NYTH36327 [Nymphaea thermarum]